MTRSNPALAAALLGLSAWAAGASGAAAETLQEKTCVLLAAEKVPYIRGMEVGAARIEPAVPETAASRVVRGYGNVLRASEELGRRFDVGDVRLDVQIKRADAQGDRQAAEAALVDALVPRLAGGASVEIDVKALGRDATLGYTCMWTPQGLVHLSAAGYVR